MDESGTLDVPVCWLTEALHIPLLLHTCTACFLFQRFPSAFPIHPYIMTRGVCSSATEQGLCFKGAPWPKALFCGWQFYSGAQAHIKDCAAGSQISFHLLLLTYQNYLKKKKKKRPLLNSCTTSLYYLHQN